MFFARNFPGCIANFDWCGYVFKGVEFDTFKIRAVQDSLARATRRILLLF